MATTDTGFVPYDRLTRAQLITSIHAAVDTRDRALRKIERTVEQIDRGDIKFADDVSRGACRFSLVGVAEPSRTGGE